MIHGRGLLIGGIASLAQILPLTPSEARELTQVRAGRTATASAADLFQLADLAVARGRPAQARQLFDVLSRDPNAEVRNEARYRHALLLEKDGRDREAAVLLRRVLDDMPNAATVRLKLATVLQRMGEAEMAWRELRALRSAELPLTVARFVDRLSAALQTSKPFLIQIEAALAPDSNINRATSSETVGTIFGDFEIDEGARSGTGIALRGMAQARRQAGDGISLAARVSGEASLYGHTQFNDISLGIAAGPEFSIGRTRIVAEAGIAQQWFGMEPYQRTLRLSGSVVQPISAVSQLRFEPGWRRTNDQVNDLRDGRGLSARIRYERALSPQLLMAVSAAADRYKAEDDAYSTRFWLVGLSASRDIGRMTLSAGADFGRLTADDRLLILPRARRDRLTRLSLGGVFRNLTIAGFAPMFRVTTERNRSTVEFYDFKRTRTEFGISRAF